MQTRMEPRIIAKDKAKRVSKEDVNQAGQKLTAMDVAESIRRGLAEVKLIEEGKVKPKNIDDLLNELWSHTHT